MASIVQVAQWLAMLFHRSRVPGSIPGSGHCLCGVYTLTGAKIWRLGDFHSKKLLVTNKVLYLLSLSNSGFPVINFLILLFKLFKI